MLSSTADEYLRSLQRISVPSEREVVECVLRVLPQVPNVWLDFHRQYGGYVQPLGVDVATWGLMHFHGEWMPNGDVEIELEGALDDAYITCADVHPSYDYRLDLRGEFLGGPSDRFETYLEQCAHMIEFKTYCAPFRVYGTADTLEPAVQRVLDDLLAHGNIKEASDRHREIFRSERALLRRTGNSFTLMMRV
jgi:hypothetical protein